MYTDVNCLLGHWPFRKIRKNTLDDLRAVHRANGISAGYIASLNSVFYNDPFEGDEELHEWIRGTEYKHVLTVNPTLPGWERDIEEGIRRFDIRGVRIYPTYHEYDPNNDDAGRLCEALERHGLPLFVTMRMEDERLDYLLKPKPLDIESLKRFAGTWRNLRVVLLNIRFGELLQMEQQLNELPNLYFDTSGLKDKVFVVEELIQKVPVEKMMYGSLHPLYALKSTYALVDFAEIGPEAKRKIFYENARVLEQRN